MDDLLERLKAALADTYAIEGELGEGGMAMVYLARDLKHDREVAIKVLRPELAASLGVERFLREIQIGAKLNHPHILPLYDSGAAEGFLYYVMPFVEGETLRDRLDRDQQLPLYDAIQLTRETADALSYAHSHGIVHRDIKPENIMLASGHAVVADFGIARAVTAASDEKLTRTGTAIGTPAYMSPEQIGGDHIDGRSDIYSLACVLYELLTGQPPFVAPTAQAIMARHAVDEVPRPQIVRQSIPDQLEDIILTALEKAPADRYQTAAEFAEALGEMAMAVTMGHASARSTRATQRRTVRGTAASTAVLPTGAGRRVPRGAMVAGAVVAVAALGVGTWQLWPGSSSAGAATASGLPANRIAVLYFEDLTPGGELQHVADGLTEGLIQQLSQVRELDVVSENGVAPYRGGDVPSDSIARALKAGSVIEGTVEQVGQRVRVTARLVDGASGADFDRAGLELPAGQLLAVRDSVVGEVSRILRSRLGEEIRLRERRRATESVEAWSLVQRAERFRKDANALRREDDHAGAARALTQADSVLALAQAADVGWIEAPLLRAEVAFDHARVAGGHDAVPFIEAGYRHAERALEMAPNDPRVLSMRGRLRYLHWAFDVTPDPDEADRLLAQARQDLEAAVQADPTLTEAHIALSYLYYDVHDVPAAMLAARRAYEEDAYLQSAAQTLERLFWGSWDLEQFNQAQRWCVEGSRRFPDDSRFVQCQLWLMATPGMPLDVDGAWQLVSRMESLLPGSPPPYRVVEAHVVMGGVIGRAGFPDSARAVFSRARQMSTYQNDPEQRLLSIEAEMRTLMGDYDEAIDLLKQYVAANPDHDFGSTVDKAWYWRDLLDHPRFSEIVSPGG